MLEKISERFYAWSKGWLIFVLFLLDGFFGGYVLPGVQAKMQDGQGGVMPLDLMLFANPSAIYSMVERYGENLSMYRTVELTIDIIYPIVYLFFFGLLMSWLFQRGFSANSKVRQLNILPLGAWFFDLLENISIVSLLSLFPTQSTILAWILVVFIHVKWLFAGASILLILVGIVMALKNGFKKQA